MEIVALSLAEIDDRVAEAEARFRAALTKSVNAAVRRVLNGSLVAAADPVTPGDADVVVDTWISEVEGKLVPYVATLYYGAADSVNQSLGNGAPAPDAAVFLTAVVNRIKDFATELWELVRNALVQGLQLGDTTQQLAKRVKAVVAVSEARALVIARTEAHSALEAGALAQVRAAGLDGKKEWRSTDDPRTRPTHVAADGQTVALAEKFEVGGAFLDFPGDPNVNAPAEIINCRCTQLFHISTDLTAEDEPQPVTAAAADFDESKVKRDTEGKFAKKASAKLPKIFIDMQVTDLSDAERKSEKKGANPGGIFALDHDALYVKQAKTPLHAGNEVLASALYNAAGVEVPQVYVATGTPELGALQTYTHLVPGAVPNLKTKMNDPQYRAEVWRGFAMDAWLANWDVVGANPQGGYDNIVTDESGNPVRIDVGGALLFTGLGAPKGGKLGAEAREVDTLRDKKLNPTSAALFGAMTEDDIRASIQATVATLHPDDIRKSVKAAGLLDSLADTLISRRKYLLDRYGVKGVEGDAPTQPDVVISTKKTVADPATIIKTAAKKAKKVASKKTTAKALPTGELGGQPLKITTGVIWPKTPYGHMEVIAESPDGTDVLRWNAETKKYEVASEGLTTTVYEYSKKEAYATLKDHLWVTPFPLVEHPPKGDPDASSDPLSHVPTWVKNSDASPPPSSAQILTDLGELTLDEWSALPTSKRHFLKKIAEMQSSVLPDMSAAVLAKLNKYDTQLANPPKSVVPLWLKGIGAPPAGSQPILDQIGDLTIEQWGNLDADQRQFIYELASKQSAFNIAGTTDVLKKLDDFDLALGVSSKGVPGAGEKPHWLGSPLIAVQPWEVLSYAGNITKADWDNLSANEQQNFQEHLSDAQFEDPEFVQGMMEKLVEWDEAGPGMSDMLEPSGNLKVWMGNPDAPVGTAEQVLVDVGKISLGDWQVLTPVQKAHVKKMVSVAAFADQTKSGQILAVLDEWDGVEAPGEFIDTETPLDAAIAAGVNWDDVIEDAQVSPVDTILAKSVGGKYHVIVGNFNTIRVVNAETGFIVDAYPMAISPDTLETNLHQYSTTWVAGNVDVSSPFASPVPAIENEQTISNWPGVAQAKYQPMQVVAVTPDGKHRIIRNAANTKFYVQSNQGTSDESDWVVSEGGAAAILETIAKMVAPVWEVPAGSEPVILTSINGDTPDNITPTISAPTLTPTSVSVPNVSGDVSGIFWSKKKTIQTSVKESGVHWHSPAAKIWTAILQEKQVHPELSLLQILHILDEGTKTKKSPTPHTDKIKKWLTTSAGQTNAALSDVDDVLGTAPGVQSATPSVSTPSAPFGGVGEGDISGLAEKQRQDIYAEFKKQPATYLSSPPADVWLAVKQMSSDYGLTTLQILRVIDDVGAKKVKAEDKHLFEKKILDWLKTPAGAAVASGKPTPKPPTPAFSAGTSVAVAPFEETSHHSYIVQSYKDLKKQHDEQMAQYGEWSPSQRKGLRAYTGGIYTSINPYLWGKLDSLSPSNTTAMRQAQLGMRLSTRPMLVHRGVGYRGVGGANSHAQLEQMVGQTYLSEGFSSASYGDTEAFSSKQVTVEIEVPPGTPMAFVDLITQSPGEHEVLLAAGLHFRIIKVSKKGSKSVVRVRVVPAP